MKLTKRALYYYSSFSGKAGRIEYLLYFLIDILIWKTLWFLNSNTNWSDRTIINLFYLNLILLLRLIPMKAVVVRRLRYLKQSVGLVILSFIPIVNLVFEVTLIFMVGKEELKILNKT